MNLPTKIKIGYRDFIVVPTLDRQDENFGDCDVNRGVIRVCTDYGPVRTGHTLLHEALHAAWASARLSDKETEERVVTGIGDVLAQIWRDNPDFVAFISESLGDR